MMNAFETYIRELHTSRATGASVAETSHYGALQNLLNEVGKTLKPKVNCVINIRNQGAGIPDGGLFTPDQLRRQPSTDTVFDQIPSRGAIEVKGTSEDVLEIAQREQTKRYIERYDLVLVTNYRDFQLVQRGNNGIHTNLERYTIADTEEQFWREAMQPRKMAERHGERFIEYLKRVMQHSAELADPKDLAWFLASYARDAKAQIESASDLSALNAVRAALEEALGLQFKDEKGEHFFRSTLVQTLFYGLFSAWVLWCKQNRSNTSASFNWREAQWKLHVPMIRALFEQISTPSKLGPLGLEHVMTLAGEVLNRVDRDLFFSRFQEEHAVQYFYEPFLEAFDPELRKDLGVWYTPPEIVEYMVARVDTVLREELGIADGLADPSVYILDPCCGTGAYLVEVLKRIEKTLRENRGDALIGHDVKKAATSRVFGFEILPAPFVIAHMQLGLALQNLSAPLKEDGSERAKVYLTNALTGWEPPQEPKTHLLLPELEQERDAADEVKQDKPILVILGNPPYNAFAGTSPKEEQGLVEPYKEGLISEWGIKKFNLDDLYVRFFRLAERRIAEKTGKGVVCFISNHSWVSDASFVVLRKHLLGSFDKFWIENMHGNRKISEYAPDGRTSETVFAIQGFSPGIQQGVAISLWAKTGCANSKPSVSFRDDLDAAKAAERRVQLLGSLRSSDFNAHYAVSEPQPANRYSFRPESVSTHYREWPSVPELCSSSPSLGILANRKDSLISIDADALEKIMRTYMDASVAWEDIVALRCGLSQNAARFDACAARTKLLRSERFDRDRIRKFLVRPMDTRWCYYTSVRPVWNEPRPAYAAQCWVGNAALVTRRHGVASPEGVPFFFTSAIGFQHALNTDAYYVPLRWDSSLTGTASAAAQNSLFQPSEVGHSGASANISSVVREYLTEQGITESDANPEIASLIWMHVLAIGYSPLYLNENADGIRQDWPRIPLPDSKDQLIASAELGRQIAALLDTENDVPGVTSGAIRPELAGIGVLTASCGGELNPDAGDLALTVGWGHGGKDGVTMPGKGKVEVGNWSNAEGLGDSTRDIYLNDRAYWKNIPSRVWDYHIGGYQVIKKWLSYRELGLLGRPLKPEEALEVTNIARRIAAILLLEPNLDANYELVKNNIYPWPAP
jgi:type I restriction-modification system DNA methylase subunit